MIRWKLNEVMARKRIRNKDLAQALEVTETSIYRLRKTDEMPRLTPERLNGLCVALDCQPGELLEWVMDDGGDQKVAQPISKQSGKDKKSTDIQQTKHRKSTRSFVTVIPEVPESFQMYNQTICLRIVPMMRRLHEEDFA